MNELQANAPAYYVSIGIIAWNEEDALPDMLESLFQQTFFAALARRKLRCEIIVLANGCTDRTVELAREVFAVQKATHPAPESFSARVVELSERGKINAWNAFVHEHSARGAEFLFLMDADIRIRNPETLRRMVETLERDSGAHVAVDRPRKDIEFKRHKSVREHLSLAASRLTRSADAQLCAQLYCIRSRTARRIYLPRGFSACDDGFIKTLVCTDFLEHSVWPGRIRVADQAEHTFEAYTTFGSILKNQKRQAIGQTIVHVLLDKYLANVPPWRRSRPAELFSDNEQSDPEWLKRLVAEHLRQCRFFWRLYPGLLTHRFKRLQRLPWNKRLLCMPAVFAGSVLSLISSRAAWKFLKAGSTQYWPPADRRGFRQTGWRRPATPSAG